MGTTREYGNARNSATIGGSGSAKYLYSPSPYRNRAISINVTIPFMFGGKVILCRFTFQVPPHASLPPLLKDR
jgi:hypothetical protein